MFTVELPWEIFDALKIPPILEILPREELRHCSLKRQLQIQMRIIKQALEIKHKLEKKYAKKEEKLNLLGIFDPTTNQTRARSLFYINLKRELNFERIMNNVLDEMLHQIPPDQAQKNAEAEELRRYLNKIPKMKVQPIVDTIASKTKTLSQYRKLLAQHTQDELLRQSDFGKGSTIIRQQTDQSIQQRGRGYLGTVSLCGEKKLADDGQRLRKRLPQLIKPIKLIEQPTPALASLLLSKREVEQYEEIEGSIDTEGTDLWRVPTDDFKLLTGGRKIDTVCE
ncbi:MAG: hypothetical protein EZS28_007879 [Streblomastix strix]|uniref:Uncharacterized protein n=1 Tax=Streblomastix strix TaxID=222440 RepID=A0A5J4WNC6_9EUKA|nr:MAG: hypothetical protein EZS28_007879 [Streblomastix strix]